MSNKTKRARRQKKVEETSIEKKIEKAEEPVKRETPKEKEDVIREVGAPKATIHQPNKEVVQAKPVIKRVDAPPQIEKEAEIYEPVNKEPDLPENQIIWFVNCAFILEECLNMNLNAELIVIGKYE
jgi:hypothetical protein